MRSVAVITDIRQPAGIGGGARPNRRSADHGDLLRRGPGRLRAVAQRGLRPDRRRATGDLRQLRLRHRPRSGGLQLRLPRPARSRARRALDRLDARAHKRALEGVHARPAVRPSVRARAQARPPRSRLAAQGERVPVRGKAGANVRAHRPRCRLRRPRLRPYPSAVDPRVRRRLVRQLRLGWWPRDGDPRGGFGVLEGDGERVRARIERFDYDAEFAASQVAESGLPAEYADRLLKAA